MKNMVSKKRNLSVNELRKMPGKNELLKQMRSLLQYHKNSGIAAYPRCRELEQFLFSLPLPSKTRLQGGTQRKGIISEPQGAVDTKNQLRQRANVAEIAQEVMACRSCGLAEKRIRAVCGRGGRRVKLFVIGGWQPISPMPNIAISDSAVFGFEEDRMLDNMFKAIQLRPEETFVSNLIKCGVADNIQPKAEHIDACISYLYRQIMATSPQVILTMGILATRALLQLSSPLSQLRGKFHRYTIDQERTVLLMPTYHPTFLLKNPEMKRATWHDLQLVDKELKKGVKQEQ